MPEQPGDRIGTALVRSVRQAKVPTQEKPKAGTITGPRKWESLWGLELRTMQDLGEIADYKFEGVRFRLAYGSYYKPDWVVWSKDGKMTCYEIKGYKRTAALVRFKVARDLYKQVRFVMLTREKGQWRELYPE
jgi:hypothetical protein